MGCNDIVGRERYTAGGGNGGGMKWGCPSLAREEGFGKALKRGVKAGLTSCSKAQEFCPLTL